jgi:hypothetical protein
MFNKFYETLFIYKFLNDIIIIWFNKIILWIYSSYLVEIEPLIFNKFYETLFIYKYLNYIKL